MVDLITPIQDYLAGLSVSALLDLFQDEPEGPQAYTVRVGADEISVPRVWVRYEIARRIGGDAALVADRNHILTASGVDRAYLEQLGSAGPAPQGGSDDHVDTHDVIDEAMAELVEATLETIPHLENDGPDLRGGGVAKPTRKRSRVASATDVGKATRSDQPRPRAVRRKASAAAARRRPRTGGTPMSRTPVETFMVECDVDGCDAWVRVKVAYTDSTLVRRRAAQEHGWSYEEGQDRCPKHRADPESPDPGPQAGA